MTTTDRRVSVLVPPEIHRKLRIKAARQDESIQQHVARLIATDVADEPAECVTIRDVIASLGVSTEDNGNHQESHPEKKEDEHHEI